MIYKLLPLGSAAFFLIAGYELARSVSKSLFVEAYGAENIPWVLAGSPVFLALMVYLYGSTLTRLGPRRTLFASTAFCATGLVICYLAIKAGSRPATALFYMFREAYIMILVEQYWSFVNSTVTVSQAKKINGPLLGISGIGAVAGSFVVKNWAVYLGSESMILLAVAALLFSAILSNWAFRLAGEPKQSAPKKEQAGLFDPVALKLVFRTRVLLTIFFLVALTQAVGLLLETRLDILIEEVFPKGMKNERSAYYGSFFFGLNRVALIFQFIGVPLLLRYLSVRKTHTLIPAANLLSLCALMIRPSLAFGAFAFGLFKSLDYSLFRAAKEILYIKLSYDARYRAKYVIDAFGYRAFKALAAGMLALAIYAFGQFQGLTYAGMAAGIVVVWIVLVQRLPQSAD